jgi:hypothetical protein
MPEGMNHDGLLLEHGDAADLEQLPASHLVCPSRNETHASSMAAGFGEVEMSETQASHVIP